MNYGTAIVSTIGTSRVFVLLLSEGSSASGQVIRELEIAVDNGIPIIPLRIEDIEPTEAMRYYIKSLHWLDAMRPPRERHHGKLADWVQAILSVEEEDQPPVTTTETVVETCAKKRWALPTWATVLLVLAAVAIVGVVGSWAISQIGSAAGSDMHPASFMIPDPQLWDESEENRYHAVGQRTYDAFAWSTETFTGDLILSLDLESPVSQ